MDEQNFLSIINRAKQVDRAAVENGSPNTAPVRKSLVSEGGRGRGNAMPQGGGDYYDDENDKEAMLEAMYQKQEAKYRKQVSQPQQLVYEQQPQYPQQGTNHTRIPSFIKESMESHPIDTSVFDPNPLNRVKIPEQQPIQEQVVARPQANTYAPQAGVDYSVMRAIINECLETKLKEHSVLNESSSPIKTILLKEGMIKIVDNKGNIFEAKLKKVGNINDDK